ncbi:hypothetical protein CkaCkLH20_07518 [Colletotrichum karsti]|uniref:Uncharacterized protein n=1 Tax=Colletotrichum karsti TaxID=1095194 RepID=A0A9P6I2G9_9PEZI|nr:uncharacterized protein CkaCkLH20_07518 [Colletotrichum karsti]KAF9874824.1 hypothetical protein CkaCkLH20_07518 [Colletotrichum karsti]
MGGKVWSPEEERVYWRVIIPQSQKRAGRSHLQTKSWEDLAIVMQSHMSADAKRNYTGLGLFEHYFANIEKRRLSPNATKYVREYKEALERAAQEEEEETEVEDNGFDEDATISDHSQNDPSHTGETTEEEVMSDSDIYEDKENRPFSSAREPLAPLPLPTSTYGPSRPAIDPVANLRFSGTTRLPIDPVANLRISGTTRLPIDPVANLRISVNLPRLGSNRQFQTSSVRDTLRNELTRDPPDYGFRPQPHESHHQHFPAMSHEHDASNSMPQEEVPAHLRGRPEDYEDGGRYFCLPTPDYRYITPEDYAAQYGPPPYTNNANFSLSRETRPSNMANLSFETHTVSIPEGAGPPSGTNNANFSLSRETRPSNMANLSFQTHTVPSPEVAFAPQSDSPIRQSNQTVTSGISQSPPRNERNIKSHGKKGSQQGLQPSLKRSYEDFSDDGSAPTHQYTAPAARMSPAPAYAAPVAEMNPNPADSYPPPSHPYCAQGGAPHPALRSLSSSGVFAHTTYNPANDKEKKPEGQRPTGPYEGPIPDCIMRPEPAHVQNQRVRDHPHFGLFPEELQETEEQWLKKLDKEFQYYEMPPPPPPAERNFSQRPPSGRKD